MSSYPKASYDIKTEINPETGKYIAYYSWIEDKGYEVIDHPFTHLIEKESGRIAEFETEDEADTAAVQVVKIKISEFINGTD